MITLAPGEKAYLLDGDSAVIAHPDRPAEILNLGDGTRRRLHQYWSLFADEGVIDPATIRLEPGRIVRR